MQIAKLICLLLLITTSAFADCHPFSVDGFGAIISDKKISIFLNKADKASLAVKCESLSISKAQALHEFNLTGKPTKASEDLYFVDIKTASGFSRSYLKLTDKSLYHVNLTTELTNPKIEHLHGLVTQALGNLK